MMVGIWDRKARGGPPRSPVLILCVSLDGEAWGEFRGLGKQVDFLL